MILHLNIAQLAVLLLYTAKAVVVSLLQNLALDLATYMYLT